MRRITRRARALAVCAVLGLAAAFASCGKKDAPRPEPVTPGSLTVAARLPVDSTDIRTSVDVVFDRPVVALGAGDPSIRNGEKILRLDPRPEGYYHWVGTRTLSYVVPDGLPPATAFHAEVPSGLEAVDGTRLGAAVTWDFATPRPQLVRSVPATQDGLFRPEDPLVLVFNQPMDPGEMEEAAVLEGAGALNASRPDSVFLADLGWRFRNVDPERAVLLRPASLLEKDHAYTLRLPASLHGRLGPLPIGREIAIPFRTYGLPGLAEAKARASLTLRLRTPVDPDTLARYLVLDPEPRRWSVGGGGVQLGVDGLAFGTAYAGTLRAGLTDLFGQVLDHDVPFRFTTTHRPPTLSLFPSTSVLTPDVPRRVIVRYGGSREVRLRATPYTVANEIHSRRGTRPAPVHWAFERLLYEGPPRDAMTDTTLDLSSLLPGGVGAILVEVSTTDPGTRDERPRVRTRWSVLRWSDLGLTSKVSMQPGRAWVTHLGSGEPVEGARVSLRDPNGSVLWEGRTGADGGLVLPGLRSFDTDRWEMLVAAETEAGAALNDAAGDWRLSSWRFHLPGDYGVSSSITAFLYGDRDLYRPGETVHLSGLVRRLETSGVVAAGVDSVRVAVHDPRGAVLADTVLVLDALGGLALDVPTGPEVPPGSLTAAVFRLVQPNPARIGSRTVRIAAYRAPTFKASVTPRRGPVFPGDTVAAAVAGSYYFGAPLAGAGVGWTLVRQETPFRPEGFEDFAFGDPETDETADRLVASGRDALSDAGTAEVSVPLPEEPFASPQTLVLEAGIQDPTGDVVSARGGVLYLPAGVVPGIAAGRRFLAAGDSLDLRLVAVRGDTSLARGDVPLTVRFIRREWRSVRKLLVGGRVGYETSRVDTLVDSLRTTSAVRPVPLTWTPPSAGSYRVEVTATDDRNRTVRSALAFYASGRRSRGLGPHTDEPYLDLTTDRETYAPGDTARILLAGPTRARRGLLTVEREGVSEARVVEFDSGTPVFEVPIRDAYMPNVFVGLSVVEPGLDSTQAPDLPPEARLPQVKMGYVTLALDTASRRLAVAVGTDRETYAPGDTARLSLRVRDRQERGVPARVSVAVVDEAVLALLQHPNPDPHGFFYAARGLGVMNDDTRLRLGLGAENEIGELKEEPGGGGEGGGGQDFRSVFATTATWNAAVMTDARGRATVKVPLPENLTRFRVVATAASGVDLFGRGQGGFRVTKPVTVDPALPRFARVGDRFEAAALVTNRSGRRISGTVTLVTDLLPDGKTEQKLRLDAGRSARVAFGVRAEREGDATVAFRGRFGDAGDAVRVTLPVEPATLPQAAAAAGHATGSVEEQVRLPVEALDGTATLDLRLSPSVLAGAEGAFLHVVDYPYGCLEQTASRLLLLSLYKELTAGSAETWIDTLDLDAKLAETVTRLQSLVTPWGGFLFWPNGDSASPAMAAYAAYALLRAERAGADLPPGLLAGAAAYLQSTWSAYIHRVGRRDVAFPLGIVLFAASELTAADQANLVTPEDLDVVARDLKMFSPDDRLFLALAFQRLDARPEVVKKLVTWAMNRVNVTAAGATAPAISTSLLPEPFRTPTRASALTLLLAERARAEDPMVPRLAHGLLGLREHGHWGTTHDDALAMVALTEYRERVETAGQGSAAFTATASLRDGTAPLLRHAFAAGSLAQAETTVVLPAPTTPALPMVLRFERTGKGDLVYEAVLRWREDALGRDPEDGGYTLMRRVDRLDGPGKVRVGDLMVVTLTVVLPRESYYLALRDPLPAGLEPVETGFQVNSAEAASRLASRTGRYARLPVAYTERRDREVRFFTGRVAPGVYQVRYLARVRAAGTFGQPPATVEAMYTPELHGASGSGAWQAEPPR